MIDAITSQNETDTDQAGRMPACAWAQEHEVAFVSKHFGPALAAANLQTKIWNLDYNFNLWGRAYNTLEDPDVFKDVDGVAWHPYVGSAQGDIERVAHVAFVSPDGRKSLVLSNTGADRKVQDRIAGAMTEVPLPASSMTNLSRS